MSDCVHPSRDLQRLHPKASARHSDRAVLPALLLGMGWLAACGSQGPQPVQSVQTEASLPAAVGTPAPSSSTVDPAALRPPPAAPKLPRALRMAYVQAAQADAGPEYALNSHGEEVSGRSPAQGFDLRFSSQGVQLNSAIFDGAGRGVQVRTQLSQLRCGDVIAPLTSAVPQASTVAAGSVSRRVTYDRGTLHEWYENGPLGVEQGFTLDRAPSDCGAGPNPELRIDVRIDTPLAVRFAPEGGGAIELRDDSGQSQLSYSDLYARDARGRDLPTRMEYDAASRSVRLFVETRDAQYPIVVDPLWAHQAKLFAPDGTNNDYFGSSVAISGDTALIGAISARVGTVGKAYVFVRSGTTWTQQAKLLPSDSPVDAFYGTAVALSGDVAVVTANRASPSGKRFSGQAYVFIRSGTTWIQQMILAPASLTDYCGFGTSASMSGNTLVIGAPWTKVGGIESAGMVYVFNRSGGTWNLEATLIASDRATLDQFGRAVAVSGDTLLVTAPEADTPAASNVGKTYVYVRSGGAWVQQAVLLASDRSVDDYMGTAVAVSGDTAVIGGYAARVGGLQYSGKAYVFARSGGSWTQQALLLPPRSVAEGFFGSAVAVSGDTVVVGEYNASPGGWTHAGQAHVFERSGTPASWRYSQTVGAFDASVIAHFGNAVAMSGSTILLGAEWATVGSVTAAGSVYVFAAKPLVANGTACADSRECLSGFCTDGVCCDSACGGGWDLDCQACSAAKKGSGADGVCGAAAKATTCRPIFGACDVAETCDGSSTACPADVKIAAGTLCRAAAGACDVAETCTGLDWDCPVDGKRAAGSVCRAAAGTCDAIEICDGGSADCPADAMLATGTVCRTATGPCDVAEVCTGSSATCPSDARAKAGTVCRAASGPCDAPEVCSGTAKSCPKDSLRSAGTVCRAAAGPCDVAESCSGTSAACPSDALKRITEVCRPAAGACDSAEFCSGSSVACPVDKFKPMIAVCRSTSGACDVAEYCTGDGPICPPDDFQPAGTLCRDQASDCDAAEVCSGTRATCPPDLPQPDGTTCRGGTCKAGMCI